MALKSLAVLFLIVFIETFSSGAQVKVRLDLTSIVDKDQNQIESVLGKPTSTEVFTPDNECPCQKIYYLNDQVAITFINGKSDWIWVYPGIELFNMQSARILAFHNFPGFIHIKVTTAKNTGCCKEA